MVNNSINVENSPFGLSELSFNQVANIFLRSSHPISSQNDDDAIFDTLHLTCDTYHANNCTMNSPTIDLDESNIPFPFTNKNTNSYKHR